MPLGAARASEYAGWWAGAKPTFLSRSAVSATQYNTWVNALSLTPNVWSIAPATRSFSNTSITSGAKGTQVITFKYQAQSNFTWGTDEFRTNYQRIKNGSGTYAALQPVGYNWATYNGSSTSTSTWPFGPARTVTGNYLSVFSSWNGYDFVKLTGNIAWDTLADRWLTMIMSFSSTSADFAGWAGGTVPSGYYASRILLQDAQTGEQLSLTDWTYSAFQGYTSAWADYTWKWDNATLTTTTDANFNWFTDAANGYFDQTDFLTGASWVAMGQTIDPTATVSGVRLGNYFVGQYLPETVNGVRAWANWTPVASTTDGSAQNLTKLLSGRSSQSTNIVATQTTTNLTSPYTDASKP